MVFIHRSPRIRSTLACVRFIELLTPQSWDCGFFVCGIAPNQEAIQSDSRYCRDL